MQSSNEKLNEINKTKWLIKKKKQTKTKLKLKKQHIQSYFEIS